MQETTPKYAVGIDIGTTAVRCIVGHIDSVTGMPTIIGVGTAPNSGMRKGNVVNLDGPSQAIDEALGEAERMSGYQINTATININGSHILSTHTDGMIAVGSADHEITTEDLRRLEEVATVGKVPANREILEIIPHSYKLDGQDNIKNPIGMTGTRLEIDAHVLSVLSPNLVNLQKAAEAAKLNPHAVVVSGVAAARAVLNEHQVESGVALIDIGGSTTNIAIYEEGDLQYAAVIPIGGINITNDLAIGLKTDPEIAEKVKISHASAERSDKAGGAGINYNGETYTFDIQEIDEIVDARLEELFEAINKELEKAGRAGKLPSGVVLTGGTAMLEGLADYAKDALGLAARVGKITDYGGVSDDASSPQFATAVGLMLIDSQSEVNNAPPLNLKKVSGNVGGILSRLFGRSKG